MKLIGIRLGEYEGNKYAKLITSEDFAPDSGSRGSNAVISKIVYDVALDICKDWELYRDQEVKLYYDRFERVVEVRLV